MPTYKKVKKALKTAIIALIIGIIVLVILNIARLNSSPEYRDTVLYESEKFTLGDYEITVTIEDVTETDRDENELAYSVSADVYDLSTKKSKNIGLCGNDCDSGKGMNYDISCDGEYISVTVDNSDDHDMTYYFSCDNLWCLTS